MLQLFYCATDDGKCETWSSGSGANLARLVQGPLVLRAPPSGLAPEPERPIVGWEEIRDVPSAQEHEELGLHFEYDFANKKAHVTCPQIGFDEANLDIDGYSAEAISSAEAGDKLFGWPLWVQGAEYPTCPQCDGRMSLVFQVDSEHGVDVMFGDLGVGHITQCPNHPNVLAFGWACG